MVSVSREPQVKNDKRRVRQEEPREGAQPVARLQYDSRLGHRYVADLDLWLPRPGGGLYHFVTNAAGIRATREYARKNPDGKTRIVLCGDSMSAGQFLSNDERLCEQLERRIEGIEVIDLSLEGSGTDQQLLLYEEVGLKYEHDLVILMPFLSNIRRNMAEARLAIDAENGKPVLRPKPRFELDGEKLRLLEGSVARETFFCEGREAKGVERTPLFFGLSRARINALPGVGFLKKAVYATFPWEPFPEYRKAASPAWKLMEAIIRRFKKSAGERPLVVAPTFYDSYVRYRMARNYWKRFASLGRVAGIEAIDLLPYFRKLGASASGCFQLPYDMHFSAFGHLVAAEALANELKWRGLLRQ